jgi:peptidoglycan hydrolase-like protein with peptidoglycan-binding domain
MIKVRNLGAMLALGALTALPACSMFGGGSSNSGSSQYSQGTPASYGTPIASNATGTSGTVAPVSPGMIRNVQTTLQQNNDYKGQIDGVWGPMTEAGVRTWQQQHNLNTNGEIDMATLQSMNISADNQANNAAATQPTGNQNYSTNPNRPTGNNYSNNNQMPPNTPAPVNQGANGNNTTNATAAPNSTTGGTGNH